MNFSKMLDNEVCSLELAQKLKYLGVKQTSIHCYYKSSYIGGNTDGEIVHGVTLTYQLKPHDDGNHPAWCAYTVSELGILLPSRLMISGMKDEAGNSLEDMVFRLRIEKFLICREVFEEHWSMNYVDEYGIGHDLIVNKLFPHNVHGPKEADVRAQLLIQCIEAGFLKII